MPRRPVTGVSSQVRRNRKPDVSVNATYGDLVFGIGLVLLLPLGFYWRAGGWDPPSLWLDDQWVGIVAKYMTWGDFVRYAPPVPIGFAAISKGAYGLFGDPEWSLQLLPLIASVLQAPMLALVVARVTGHRALGFLSACFLMINPSLNQYGVLVKPYATDALITASLLFAGLPLLQAASKREIALFGCFGLVASLFSIPSVWTSVLIVWLATLFAGIEARRFPAAETAVALCFSAALSLLYAGVLRHQSNEELTHYWQSHFLPTNSLQSAVDFIADKGWIALYGAVPLELGWAIALLIPGFVFLLVDSRLRPIGFFVVALYVALLFGSALHIYPMGGGRTDTFIYPVTALVMCCGVRLLLPWRRAPGVCTGLTVLLGIAVLYQYGRVSAYLSNDDARLVRTLEQKAQPGDGVLFYPQAETAIGYYTEWPLKLVSAPSSAYGFAVELQRSRTAILSYRRDFRTRPELLAPELQRFLSQKPARILYLATHAGSGVQAHNFIQTSILRAGYRPVEALEAPDAQLIVYEIATGLG